jgi:hypothetical protein
MCVEAIQKVPESQDDDDRRSMILVRMGIMIYFVASAGSPDWLLGMGLLLQLYQSGAKMPDLAAGRTLAPLGLAKLGFTDQNPNPSIGERMEGFTMVRQGFLFNWIFIFRGSHVLTQFRNAGYHFWLAFLMDKTILAIPANRRAIGSCGRIATAFVPSDIWTGMQAPWS